MLNDVLLGGLYLTGSIATILDSPKWIRQWSYLLGAFFMLMRPILKILRNVFIYDKKEFREKVTDTELLGSKSKEKDLDEDYEESKSQKEKMEEIKKQED